MSRRAVGLLFLVLLAIGLRAAADAYTHAAARPAEENRLIARNLAAGRGFTFTEFGVTGPTAVRAPLYPMLLALIGPDRVPLILAFNAVAGGLTVLAAFALAVRLVRPAPPPAVVGNYRPLPTPAAESPRPTAAPWVAAVLFAVWPTQAYAATLTQGLAVAVLLCVAALALAWRRGPAALIAGGFVGGLAALTEPVLVLPLMLAALVLGTRRRMPDAALFLLVMAVTVSPWLYRNAVVFGRPMPLTSNGWRDAFLGNGAAIARSPDDVKDRIARLSPPDYDRLKVPEPRRAAVYRDWTMAWARAHPLGYAGLCFSRATGAVFGAFDHPLAGNPVYTVARSVAAIGFFCLAVLVTRPAGRPYAIVCAVLMLGLVLSTAFTLADARLSVLMDVPQLLALAATLGLILPRRVTT